MFVYTLVSTNTWSEKQKLISDDIQQYDYFGYSMAAYGTVIAVGADGVDANEVTDTGNEGHCLKCIIIDWGVDP